MNPLELARKIEAVVADYDIHTATTALEVVKLLVHYRKSVELDFNQQMLKREKSDLDT